MPNANKRIPGFEVFATVNTEIVRPRNLSRRAVVDLVEAPLAAAGPSSKGSGVVLEAGRYALRVIRCWDLHGTRTRRCQLLTGSGVVWGNCYSLLNACSKLSAKCCRRKASLVRLPVTIATSTGRARIQLHLPARAALRQIVRTPGGVGVGSFLPGFF